MELLTIGELSARSGLAPSALRFYESEGLLPAQRTSGGQRRYPRSALRRVAFVRSAQRVGLTLDEVRQALASLPDERPRRRPTGGGCPAPGSAGSTSALPSSSSCATA